MQQTGTAPCLVFDAHNMVYGRDRTWDRLHTIIFQVVYRHSLGLYHACHSVDLLMVSANSCTFSFDERSIGAKSIGGRMAWGEVLSGTNITLSEGASPSASSTKLSCRNLRRFIGVTLCEG